MAQIIPAILATSEAEFREKIDKVRDVAAMVHIDVMDGVFVDTVTWTPPEKMKKILGDLPFEAHLMVAEPEHAAVVWLAAGARRVFVHAEATNREGLIIRSAPRPESVGLVLNPETPVSRVLASLPYLQAVLVMGVNPGKSGQEFQPAITEKIAALKKLKPSLVITVDGGVKPENAALLVKAGADILAAATALTDSPDPMLAAAKFVEALNQNNPGAPAPKTAI
jgi:ribulose-phosphate 3-epimerase